MNMCPQVLLPLTPSVALENFFSLITVGGVGGELFSHGVWWVDPGPLLSPHPPAR